MGQNTEIANNVKTKARSALSGWPMVLGWLAMLIFALHACTHMVGAGDTWVALACGRHFINHGVDTVEPFSANSHKAGPTEQEIKTWPNWAQWITDKVGLETVRYWHPTGWVNQNWLTHVIFYWLTTLSPFADADTNSFNTLVYWKFAIYILTVICVYYMGRLLGVNPALSAVFACFAMFVGRSFLDIRPAGFSNLLVAVFLLVLVLATYRNILYIWLVVPLVVLWCNLHGGYIYAFIMLVPFAALNLLTVISKKWFVSIGLKGVLHSIAAGFVAFIAAVIFNPFHLTNFTHTFIISVSKHAERWRTVNEWHPSFEWSNPVGTSFPFLVLYILSIGVLIFWLFSRLFKPKRLKAPKNELDAQKKRFTILSQVLGWAAVIFIGWVIFISFSFLELDAADFLICAVFTAVLLLSIYKSVHFIYLQIPLILLVLYWADSGAGYSGRYIYPFVLMPFYVILHIFASIFSKNIKISSKNIVFVAVTAAAAVILMTVLINPFKFKLPVWHVSQFLDLHRLWNPRYEGSEALYYTHLFGVLYIVNIISVAVWLAIPYLRRIFQTLPNETESQAEAETYQLPKIDPNLIVIAALTVYMAIRSRRFIPIAAIAACPVIAMFIDQMTRTIAAACNFHGFLFSTISQNAAPHKPIRLTVPSMPVNWQRFFTLAAAIAVLGFGTWWSLKFKSVYLGTWHNDPKLTSVFIRMTASDAKPFYACQFIKENELSGKMFNYWTEGGFIAWGEQPDPNTGRIPLQLFMDGRAQAAYEPEAYTVWSNIMFGGPFAQSAKLRNQEFDYEKIGRWTDEQMKKYDAWVILMPAVQFGSPLVKGIERIPSWFLAFYNNKQKLFVDRTTPQGNKLFEDIVYDRAVYPDDASKYLVKAHNMLLFGKGEDAKKQGFEFAVTAVQLDPSQATMLEILAYSGIPPLAPIAYNFCISYVNDFAKNKDSLLKQNGYRNRIIAALTACLHLESIAKKQNNTEMAQFYTDKKNEYEDELKRLSMEKRW